MAKMRERQTDGKLQIMAAMSLLKFSRLVRWDTALAEFVAVPRDSFESDWRSVVDPVFGRLICWINFSAGAEFMAKGTCLLCDVEIRKPQKEKIDFGTLRKLYTPPNGALWRLCAAVNAEDDQRQFLVDAYKHLASDIRNRDAHAYVPNVRNDHFDVVRARFVPCFKLLLSWMPDGPNTINKWMDDASEFIGSLGGWPKQT